MACARGQMALGSLDPSCGWPADVYLVTKEQLEPSPDFHGDSYSHAPFQCDRNGHGGNAMQAA